jgi:hypothetical protein
VFEPRNEILQPAVLEAGLEAWQLQGPRAAVGRGHLPALAYRADKRGCSTGNADHNCRCAGMVSRPILPAASTARDTCCGCRLLFPAPNQFVRGTRAR